MKKFMIAISLIGIFNTSIFANNGEELFKQKCTVCHTIGKPNHDSEMLAPPAQGVIFHLKEAFSSNKEIQNYINDFVLNPSKEKAICQSVKRFGVMPSLKGSITKEELELVSKWMVENLKVRKGQWHGKGHGKGYGSGEEKNNK